MKLIRAIYSDTGLAYILGIGLVLMSLHSEWFILHQGEKTLIFLPQWGFICMAIVAGTLYLNKRFTKEHLQPIKLTIAMILLVTFTCITCLANFDGDQLANALFITCMPLFYLSARVLGKCILWPMVWASVIESISVICYVLFFTSWDSAQALTTGGILSETNYAIGTAFIAFGTVCGFYLIRSSDYKAIFLIINLLGMLFTGSPETFVIIGVIGVYLTYKKLIDFKYTYAIVMVIVLMGMWFTIGAGSRQYDRVGETVSFVSHGDIAKAESWNDNTNIDSAGYSIKDSDNLSWGQGRLPAYKRAISNMSFLGHGYYVYQAQEIDGVVIRPAKVHNVPLVVLDQVGIIPFITWIFITCYCFIISPNHKLKIIWLCLIALGLFNHTTWTVFAPYWWVAIGLMIFEWNKQYENKAAIQEI